MSSYSIVYSDKQILTQLRNLENKSKNVKPALEQAGAYLVGNTKERFDREVDPSGVPWTPNSPRTIAWKRANGRINKVLQSTGKLKSSISYKTTGKTLTIKSDVPYASRPQLGIGQPVREYLGISEEESNEILAILSRYITSRKP